MHYPLIPAEPLKQHHRSLQDFLRKGRAVKALRAGILYVKKVLFPLRHYTLALRIRRRPAVLRENIEKQMQYLVLLSYVLRRITVEHRIHIYKLCKGNRKCATIPRQHLHMRIDRFLFYEIQEPLIVRPRHSYIHVIIPRYKAVVADRTEQRAPDQIIPQAMGITVGSEFFHHGKKLSVNLIKRQRFCFFSIHVIHDTTFVMVVAKICCYLP